MAQAALWIENFWLGCYATTASFYSIGNERGNWRKQVLISKVWCDKQNHLQNCNRYDLYNYSYDKNCPFMSKITYHTVRSLDSLVLKKTCVTQDLSNLGYKITKNYSTLLQLGRAGFYHRNSICITWQRLVGLGLSTSHYINSYTACAPL